MAANGPAAFAKARLIAADTNQNFLVRESEACKIFEDPGCSADPVSLIAAIGEARIGKSTLLELILHGECAELTGKEDQGRDVVQSRTYVCDTRYQLVAKLYSSVIICIV